MNFQMEPKIFSDTGSLRNIAHASNLKFEANRNRKNSEYASGSTWSFRNIEICYLYLAKDIITWNIKAYKAILKYIS